MKKLVIELDEKFYKYVCEEVKSDELVYQAIQNGIPLEEELEKIKVGLDNLAPLELIHKSRVLNFLDNRISELKGE